MGVANPNPYKTTNNQMGCPQGCAFMHLRTTGTTCCFAIDYYLPSGMLLPSGLREPRPATPRPRAGPLPALSKTARMSTSRADLMIWAT